MSLSTKRAGKTAGPKKVVSWKSFFRGVIFAICLAAFGFGAYEMHVRYDPLARYPYGTPEERRELLALLDQNEIDLLIDAQLTPEIILPFASDPDFEIGNALFYYSALNARKNDTEAIVQFVNQYKTHFTPQTLGLYLRHYTYQDLISFLESGLDAVLAINPADPELLLNDHLSVYTYQPDGLAASQDGIMLMSEAATSWDVLRNAAAAEGIGLEAEDGYISYPAQKDILVKYPNISSAPYGSWEEQLGYTVTLKGARTFQEAAMTEYEKAAAAWLENNAWKYGFVIRHPKTAENTADWNPFVLRYTGLQTAAEMKENGKTLEEIYGV